MYVGIGVYFQTFRHLAIAVAVAPLMLLRTDASVHWGLNKYQQAREKAYHTLSVTQNLVEVLLPDKQSVSDKESISVAIAYALLSIFLLVLGVFFLSLTFFVVSVLLVVIRVVATLYWAIRKPLRTLRGMPQNWLRQSFCTDIFYPPELLPLEAFYGKQYGLMGFSYYWNDLISDLVSPGIVRRLARAGVSVLFLLSLSVFGWIPSLLYRLSLKATCAAYSPFVWIAQRTLRSASSVKLRLERITKGELEKTGLYLSALALSALAAKIGLVFGSASVIDIMALFFDRKVVENIGGFLLSAGLSGEVHNIWPWWPFVLLAIAALLSFGLFYYADAALSRLDSKDSRDAWPEQNVITIVSTASFLRATLAVVAMAYFFQRALVTVAGDYLVLADV